MDLDRPPPSPELQLLVRRAVSESRRQYVLGTTLLLGVVLLWVSSSFLMNSMFTSMNYNKPFLVTYLCTATFTFYLIRPTWTYLQLEHEKKRIAPSGSITVETTSRPRAHTATKSSERLASMLDPVGSITDSDGNVYMRPDFAFRARSQSRSISRPRSLLASNANGSAVHIAGRPLSTMSNDPPLTIRETASLALLFCGLWFSANWSMNASLGYTSVSSTTILSSMSGFFTLAVGSCVGVEAFTSGKLGSVVLSILGVIIISKFDSTLPPTTAPFPLLGDSLALLSALAYAFYVILLKVRIRTEARVSMTLFFGFVGLFNILLIWPIGVILHLTRIERFELPHGGMLWLSIAINAMITFVSDALYLKAMLMTSPLAVTLGISLTIPLAIIGDWWRGSVVGWKTVLGGTLVLGSFLANGLMDLRSAKQVLEEVNGDSSLSSDDGSERERLLSERRI
ncbi:BQ5605_C027g10322 [Microbotryum silenes-dioicae]|uniref:BQ5605_C027g10322 protein n=1 Tax=Microbotryum silenes-dioicae TaxID=796604 RepID=A0A2X0NFX2_9BASI|nr:BQ5605_C027g10322 [Microbotryum silenes-dioicae]